tara:strand:+ start:2825 stop:3808 length:984 start_codon:yes stop_codon:yes gene_type:complete
MAFQNKAGSIILDATLTDVGRRHLSQGKLQISKFSLGDDEIDYSLGTNAGGEYLLENPPPTLEAPANETAAIIHGLINYNRQDILLLPEYKLNNKLKNAVNEYQKIIYLSVNDETTKKISTVFDISKYLLESDNSMKNCIIFESGISFQTTEGTEKNQKRFIHNLDLHDKYLFVYLDSRFFESLLSTSLSATAVRMDAAGNEKSNFQSLEQAKSVTLTAPAANYDTYYCTSVMNNIYDDSDSHQTALSVFDGPRGCFLPLNFIVNKKMKSKSNGTADVRYSKFGETSQDIFGDGNKYDYVDTNVMIEGTASARSQIARIRIIRFSGT